MYKYLHVLLCMCKVQKKISIVLFSSETGSPTDHGTRLAASKLPNPSLTALQALEFQECIATSLFIYECWRFQIRSSRLHSKGTYPLSHLLNSQNHFVTMGVKACAFIDACLGWEICFLIPLKLHSLEDHWPWSSIDALYFISKHGESKHWLILIVAFVYVFLWMYATCVLMPVEGAVHHPVWVLGSKPGPEALYSSLSFPKVEQGKL